MTTVTLELPAERVEQLQQRADALGITLEELLHLGIRDLLTQSDADVQRAIRYVLEKNEALYRRLA